MGNATRVSVVMCTRNGARYIGSQTRSILSQTRPVDEIVIGDDASSDGTLAAIEELCGASASAPPLRVLRREVPLGVAANFADALAASTGDVIVLSDQDDEWEPHKVAALLACFDGKLPMAVATDAALIDAQGHELGELLWSRLALRPAERAELLGDRQWVPLLRRNVATGATMAVNRPLLEAALPIPPGWLHDEWLAIVAAALGRLVLLDQPLTRYRMHEANVVGVRQRNLATFASRLFEERSGRNHRLLVRAGSLADWCDAHANLVPAEMVAAARAKLAHERMRSKLPRHRLARPVAVLAATTRGDYRAYGGGVRDALRDLLQPAGREGRADRSADAR